MRRPKQIVAALMVVAAAAGVLGCGNSDPEPSIPIEDATALAGRIDEIRDNVDDGSCVVALDRTDQLIGEINGLPDEVNQEVQNALAEGANNLKGLIDDQCERTETVTETEPTETQETETQETEPTETEPTQTQTTPTQTTPTTPGGGSGGVGPGGIESP